MFTECMQLSSTSSPSDNHVSKPFDINPSRYDEVIVEGGGNNDVRNDTINIFKNG